MVVAFQPQEEATRIKQRAVRKVPGPMVFGDPHLEHPAKADDAFFVSTTDTVEMRGHHGIHPELNLAVERLERQDVGDLSDIFVVPEQDFVVAGNAEMVQLFHSRLSLYCLQDRHSREIILYLSLLSLLIMW